MKLQNAGLTTVTEAVRYLVDGGVLYLTSIKNDENLIRLYFDIANYPDAPFRSVVASGPRGATNEPINASWQRVGSMMRESPWYNAIPAGGIICRVHDSSPSQGMVTVVVGMDNGRFVCERSLRWENATPINITQDFGSSGEPLHLEKDK